MQSKCHMENPNVQAGADFLEERENTFIKKGFEE